MKRIFLMSAVLLAGSMAGFAQTSGKYKDGLLKCPADKLANTEVTAHLEAAIIPGKNLIWCSSFQLAWNEACTLIGEDLHFVEEPPMVAVMNKKGATNEDIDEASSLIIADWLNPGLTDRIAKAIKDKFGDKADPQLLNEVKGTVSEAVRAKVNGLFAYAYLMKELSFAVPFEEMEEPLVFEGKPVAAFGIANLTGRNERMKQVKLLYHKEGAEEAQGADEYVVELKTTSPEDRLILAMMRPEKTLGETVAKVQGLAEGNKEGRKRGWMENAFENLVVPKVNFDVTKDYRELVGLEAKVANPRMGMTSIFVAAQRIRFKLDEKGVVLHSEAALGIWGGPPPRLVFDRPFLMMMERKGAKTPYFAMWVGNAEMLSPSKGVSQVMANMPFTEARDLSEGLAAVNLGKADYEGKNGKWGFIDSNGGWAVQAQYARVGDFHEGLAKAAVKVVLPKEKAEEEDKDVIIQRDGEPEERFEEERAALKWGFINRTGKWVVEAKYDVAGDFHEGFAAVGIARPHRVEAEQDKRGAGEVLVERDAAPEWGFIDRTGKEIVKPEYDGVAPFKDGIAFVRAVGEMGYVDGKGKLLGGRLFTEVGRRNEGEQRSGDPLWDGPWGADREERNGEIFTDGGFVKVTRFSEGMIAITDGDKWGFMDTTGRMVVPPRYEDVEGYSQGRAAVWTVDEYGFIDKTGREVCLVKFGRAKAHSEGLAVVEDAFSGKFGYVDLDGKAAFEAQFDYARSFREGKAAVRVGDKWGFINKRGKWVVEPQFDNAWSFRNGLAMVFEEGKTGCVDGRGRILAMVEDEGFTVDSGGTGTVAISGRAKKGYIDREGRMVVGGDFGEVTAFSEGLAAVERGGKWGYIDRNGKWAIAAKYESARGFQEGLAAAVESKGNWGYIDKEGKWVVRAQFGEAQGFSEGLAAVKDEGKWGYVDRTGKMAVAAQFEEAEPFCEGIAVVKTAINACKFVDTQGKFITDKVFDRAENFRDGTAMVTEGYKSGFIDKSGKLIGGRLCGEVKEFSQGLAAVNVDGEWGCIDKEGKMVIEPTYEEMRPFTGDLAAVMTREGRWGYVDRGGRMAVTPEYSEAQSFSEGLAAVRGLEGKWGYIDAKGKKAGKMEFEGASEFREGLAAVKMGGKWGFVDKGMKTVIKPAYDEAGGFRNERALVQTVNRARFIDTKGRFVGAEHYDEAEDMVEELTPAALPGGMTLVGAGGKVKSFPDTSTRGEFSEGLCSIWTPDGVGWVDANGEWAISPRGDLAEVDQFHDGLAVAYERGGKCGFIDRKGKWAVRPVFERATPFAEGLACVMRYHPNGDLRFGFVKKNGEMMRVTP